MTFYEAALLILKREGKPLHVSALTELVLLENILSHVGKTPQEVMESRLLTMARRRRDRHIAITAPHTFGLVEWGLDEDLSALDLPIEESAERFGGPLLRGRERHPTASAAKVKISGRGERTRGNWRDEDEDRKRRRKQPTLVEAAIDVFSAIKQPLSAVDLAAAARDKVLVSDDLGADALVHALREENRRRQEAGKRAPFEFLPSGEIAFRPELLDDPGDRGAAPASPKVERALTPAKLVSQAAEQRKNVVRGLRRRLSELEAPAFEKAMEHLLGKAGYLDLKVARRNRDGLIFVARRREGLVDVRCAIRLIRGSGDVSRQDVEELRRNLSQFGSQIGLIVSAGDVAREARQEATARQPLVFLLCADALAESCLENAVGTSITCVELYDLDEAFFRRCGEQARDDRDRRRSAREGRKPDAGGRSQRGEREPRPTAENAAPGDEGGETAAEPAPSAQV